jgi:hypothetical protein
MKCSRSEELAMASGWCSNELARLLTEPSVFTSRPAESLLIVLESPGILPKALVNELGIDAKWFTLDFSCKRHSAALMTVASQCFESGFSVAFEVIQDPHPSLYQWLRLLSETGTYSRPSNFAGTPRLTVPAGCKVVAVVDDVLFSNGVVPERFGSCFEVIERV